MLVQVSFCFLSLAFKDEIPFLKLHLYILTQRSRKMWQYEKMPPPPVVMTHGFPNYKFKFDPLKSKRVRIVVWASSAYTTDLEKNHQGGTRRSREMGWNSCLLRVENNQHGGVLLLFFYQRSSSGSLFTQIESAHIKGIQ